MTSTSRTVVLKDFGDHQVIEEVGDGEYPSESYYVIDRSRSPSPTPILRGSASAPPPSYHLPRHPRFLVSSHSTERQTRDEQSRRREQVPRAPLSVHDLSPPTMSRRAPPRDYYVADHSAAYSKYADYSDEEPLGAGLGYSYVYDSAALDEDYVLPEPAGARQTESAAPAESATAEEAAASEPVVSEPADFEQGAVEQKGEGESAAASSVDEPAAE